MATQAASVALYMFKHRAKTMATHAASVALNMFEQCQAIATQAASISLKMFKHSVKQWPHKQRQYHSTCLNTGLSNGHTSSVSITQHV